MKAKNVNLLFAFVAVLLFGFSCFCISRMNQTSEKVNIQDQDETLPNQFEVLKFFLPHLRTAGELYPDIATSKGRAGVMTPKEEEDSVVIVSVADTEESYLKSVVRMVKTKFRKQVQSGVLEVISIPTLFYPQTLLDKKTAKDSESWHIKQVLDFCILMLYAQPKATYYLQIGKLFRSKDLVDFVRFFLMFYETKPIDILLNDIFLLRVCTWGEPLRRCLRRKKEIRIQYRPSLFQHVGTQSSFPGREQNLKVWSPKTHVSEQAYGNQGVECGVLNTFGLRSGTVGE
ncbi:Alpha-1,3-mannosyl-glycoprotein 4-beta-N-acetylglucosaminyltransferase-like protein MGAT4D [Apodemus speciosus]|uniref:Alpha-1,3-mannosyl-glycoprotein 4-beta-N-acetylglucosaminyltransferase-like protein MGAT4D n=1 Tax=Apodemus speciosus TaxID=105296 RepID=A0ABQ0F248_APOSI